MSRRATSPVIDTCTNQEKSRRCIYPDISNEKLAELSYASSGFVIIKILDYPYL